MLNIVKNFRAAGDQGPVVRAEVQRTGRVEEEKEVVLGGEVPYTRIIKCKCYLHSKIAVLETTYCEGR